MIHFIGGKSLAVIESFNDVREGLFTPNFQNDFFTFASFRSRVGERTLQVLVQPASVAYVIDLTESRE